MSEADKRECEGRVVEILRSDEGDKQEIQDDEDEDDIEEIDEPERKLYAGGNFFDYDEV